MKRKKENINMNNVSKLVAGLVAVIVVTVLIFVFACNRIEPGYVGIKVNQAGSNRGVEDYPVLTGWVFYFPVTTRVYEYPVFQQNVVWAEAEQISWNCKGGASIAANVSMSGRDLIRSLQIKLKYVPDRLGDTIYRRFLGGFDADPVLFIFNIPDRIKLNYPNIPLPPVF